MRWYCTQVGLNWAVRLCPEPLLTGNCLQIFSRLAHRLFYPLPWIRSVLIFPLFHKQLGCVFLPFRINILWRVTPNIIQGLNSIYEVNVLYIRYGNYKKFWWSNLRETGHLEDQGEDGRVILWRSFKNLDWGGVMDWIDLAQSRDRWQAIVSAVMHIRFL